MKIKQSILSTLAIMAIITWIPTAVIAHSAHNHSTVPFKWELSKNIKAKMEKNLGSDSKSILIGLSHFEQKKLDHYDIKVGNKFNTTMQGINFLMERTSAGMKMVDANRIGNITLRDQLPIKQIIGFSKVSMNPKSHMGHYHAYIPIEWTFGLETQDKIVRGMIQQVKNIYVGLNKFEQSLLKEYEIKTGNSFQTKISDHKFLIEKTSSGVKVINHSEVEGVAMVPQNHSNM